MILLIDNYDSFVHNLARYVRRQGRETFVVRNDSIAIADIGRLNPEAIILSPGPCTPAESGISMDVIRNFREKIPLLGVCLGHQCIGEAFGGRTIRARRPVHGKTSPVVHDGSGLFHNIPSPLKGARYHSLIVDLPPGNPLTVTARSEDDGAIMALTHSRFPVFGVQFHPESILTDHGSAMIENFLGIADKWNGTKAAA